MLGLYEGSACAAEPTCVGSLVDGPAWAESWPDDIVLIVVPFVSADGLEEESGAWAFGTALVVTPLAGLAPEV
jgi:hypothetical protein